MRNLTLTIFVLVFSIFTLVGCGDKETESNKVKFVAGLPDVFNEIIESYNSSQDKYEVEYIELVNSSDLYSKISMMMQSPKTSPDVITEDGFMIHSDSAAGYLLPLDDKIKDWAEIKNFIPSILDGSRGHEGKLYGIPMSTDVQGIWYNKKLFKKAGINVPWQPNNWEDIISAAEKIKSVGGEDFIPLFFFSSKILPEQVSMRTFQALYSGTGSSLYDFDKDKWVVDKENLMKVFNFVNEVYNVKKIGAPLSIANNKTVEDLFVSDYMKNDKLGMLFTGHWIANQWAEGTPYQWDEALDNWGFANHVTYNGQEPKYTTMSGGWTYAIPQNAKNKEGALDFLQYLISKDMHKYFLLETRELSVRNDIIEDEEYQNQKMSVVKEASELLNYAHFRPSLDKYSILSIMFTEVIESITISDATPEQAYDTFKREMLRIAGDDKVIVIE